MNLHRLAVAEGLTLLILIGLCVPLKYLAHWPQGVRFVGPVHGLVFLVYSWALIESDLPLAQRWRCFFGAFIPGAFLSSRFRP